MKRCAAVIAIDTKDGGGGEVLMFNRVNIDQALSH